jgi:catechol 2,3-dioxygenase-like lactoylglutathione lyase family enzyme
MGARCDAGVAMYDHLGLRVKDLEASVRFYAASLKEQP